MSDQPLVERIRGIVPPLTTPFTSAETVDELALRAEVRYLVEHAHVHGLAIGGSTGEGHTLTSGELRQIVGAAVDEAAGRVPIIAGIIVDSTKQAIEAGLALSDLEVAALQVTPVHYLFRPNDEMMNTHFASIAEATRKPVLIYNVIPWAYCSPALVTRIITSNDGVVGVKQSAQDLKMLADLLVMLAGRGVVMSAVDALLYPSFCLGADGAIAAILTAVPELCVGLWDAIREQDHREALRLHGRLLGIWNAIEGDNLPANVKTALRLQGRVAGLPRTPMAPSSTAQVDAIRAALVAAEVQLA